MTDRILFTDKDHSWTVPIMDFCFSGVTNPLPLSRVVFSSPNEWSWLTVDQILERTKDYSYQDSRLHKKFYDILECMRTLETLYRMYELYTSGSSHIGNHKIDLKDEIKAVKTVKEWIRFANNLNDLVDGHKKLKLTNQLVLKIARETRPTIFQMKDGSRYYDGTKSQITYLSPYENNTEALKKHKVSDDCITGKSKIKQFLEVGY